MKAGKIKSLIMVVLGCFYAFCAHSAVSLFSDYGQIQNVQNYSTNPFWSPKTPYNQKIPQPVYVQGVNVTTDECIKVIQSAVAFQCSARDNCRNTQLADIRPAIVVQLSNLPGKAYGTACAGYLDRVFESYVAQFGNYAPTKQVDFPSGSNVPNPSINNTNTIQIKNPYEIKTPQWQQEINERTQELQELQSENGAGNESLSATAFPATYSDLSFTARMANEAAGYAPYKDKSAYKTINLQNAAEWCSNHTGPECDEYYCSIGGPKQNDAACITYRCAKEDYSKSHKEECICAEKGKASFECMQLKCNDKNDFSKSNECHEWKCTNDPTYSKANQNKCAYGVVQGTIKDEQNAKITQLATELNNQHEIIDKCKFINDKINTETIFAVLQWLNTQHKIYCDLCGELPSTGYKCCSQNETDCIKGLCTGSEEFRKEHSDSWCKDDASKEKNTYDPIEQIAQSLCPSTKYTQAEAEKMFKWLQTPNIASAKLLAKMLFYCIKDINYNEYDMQNPIHGAGDGRDNYIQFQHKTDKSNFIRIWFDDTTNNTLFDIDHLGRIWQAICYISGGESSMMSYYDDYICYHKSPDISNDLVNIMPTAFNTVFEASKVNEKAKITTCIKRDTQRINCSHE